jgi:hypothetical protein
MSEGSPNRVAPAVAGRLPKPRRLVAFEDARGAGVGMLSRGPILVVSRRPGLQPLDLELAGISAVDSLREVVPENEARLLAPVRPRTVFSVEDNFDDQPAPRRAGLARQRPPMLEPFLVPGPADSGWFLCRDAAGIVGPRGVLPRPLDCVVGVTVALDLVRHDVPGSQNYPARALPVRLPLGPALACGTELLKRPLDLTLLIDGETRQQSTTARMVRSPAHLIAAVARRIRLEPGDLILTGSPGGTAADRGEGWLRDGQRIAAEIEGLGSIELAVAEER